MKFQIIPDTASTFAEKVDPLWWFLVILTVVMTGFIAVLVFTFAMKYRRRGPNEKTLYIHGSTKLELFWSITPLIIFLGIFFWNASLYYDYFTPPPDCLDVYITGKQWMWKVQYPEGQREINELHVPVGRPVKLTMASEDVIHSFFVPAFRLKRDVVPGHHNTTWFQATKTGRFHWFCAEYCGTQHSGMIGWVTVMEPTDYENWLAGGGVTGSMASQGEKLFQQLGCSTCHLLDEQGRCPILRHVYSNPVKLDDGRTVTADDGYIRESILNPNAKIVAGFKRDIMPTFQGQVSEEGLMQLLAYIKSLSKGQQPATGNQTIGAQQTGQGTGTARMGGSVPRSATGGPPTGAIPVSERTQNPTERKK